jgi:DNA-binding CsgD family transcriptional regulator
MTEPRPHRPALAAAAAATELRAAADAGRLDAAAVEAVLRAAGHRPSRRGSANPDGLTRRELEVLEQVVRDRSIKQIARALGIAPKTADGHLQRIYAKIGVSSRAGAALYAMRHGLVGLDCDSRGTSGRSPRS